MPTPKPNRLNAGAKISDQRSKRVTGAVDKLLKLLEDKQHITKEKADMILDSCGDLRDPNDPSQRYVACQGAQCPPPKFFEINKNFGEVYATVPEIGKDGKLTGKTTVGRCVPVGSVRATDRKKIELEERIRNILRRLEPVLPKIQKLTDFANAIEACSTFQTEEMCRQPTIGDEGAPKCFPEKTGTGKDRKFEKCVDSNAYALAKATGFKDRLKTLEADLASVTAQLANPQFNLFGESTIVPRDPKRRSAWRKFQNLSTRQKQLNAQIGRLINKSDLVNQALEKGLQDYNKSKGLEELCNRVSSETYGSCIDGSNKVCMVVQPGTGSNAGYIYETTEDSRKQTLGDAKCLPVVGRDRTFVYNEKTGNVHHLAADGRETTLSKTYWDTQWSSAASYIPGGKWIASTVSGYRPGIDDSDEWMAQIGNETTRLQAMMYKLDQLYNTAKELFKDDADFDIAKDKNNNNKLKEIDINIAKVLIDDAWVGANNVSGSEVNHSARYVKMYKDVRTKYNDTLTGVLALQKNLKASAPSETVRIQNILMGSDGLSDDVRDAVFQGQTTEMKAQLAHTIAVHKASCCFKKGELVTYQYEGDALRQTPGWNPTNKKDMTGIVQNDHDGTKPGASATISVKFDNTMTFDVDVNHVGKYYQDMELQKKEQLSDEEKQVLSGTTKDQSELGVYVYQDGSTKPDIEPDPAMREYAQDNAANLMGKDVKELQKLAEAAETESIVRRSSAGTIGFASRAGTYLADTFSGMYNYMSGGASAEEFMSTDGESDLDFMSTDDEAAQSIGDISFMSTEIGNNDAQSIGDISFMSTEIGNNDAQSVGDISLMSTELGSEAAPFDVNKLYEEYYSNGETASIASSVSHL